MIGFVGGIELPPIKAAYEGWVTGAKAVNPKVRAASTYLNSFDDAAAGREAALALIRAGADMFHHNADAGGPRRSSRRRRSRPASTSSARTPTSRRSRPDRVLGSRGHRPAPRLPAVAREVRAGSFKPKVESFGLASGVVRYEANPALDCLSPRRSRPGLPAAADSHRGAGTLHERQTTCRVPSRRLVTDYLDSYLRIARGARRAQRRQRAAGREPGTRRPHRRGGRRVPRRRSTGVAAGARAERPPPGPSWAVLGRQRAAHRPPVPADARCSSRTPRCTPRIFRSTFTPRSATTSCSRGGSGIEVEGWFGDYQGSADRRVGAAPGA